MSAEVWLQVAPDPVIRIGSDSVENVLLNSDYEALENKPSIGGVELVGELTLDELGIPTMSADTKGAAKLGEGLRMDGEAVALDSHEHSASDVTDGTLAVERGGTGKGSHAANAILAGNGTGALGEIPTADGALFATAANGAASFGTLPVGQGGTGSTTAAGARQNLNAATDGGASYSLAVDEQRIADAAAAAADAETHGKSRANSYGLCLSDPVTIGNITLTVNAWYEITTTQVPSNALLIVPTYWSNMNPKAPWTIVGRFVLGSPNQTIDGLKVKYFYRPSLT